MRFVHVADVHLDTSFAGRSEAVRQRLREASRDAFRRAVDLAVREDAHALLVAGDLFDGDRLSFQTERFLLEQAGRLQAHGVTLVYATGNHDPGGTDAGPRRLPWPANVRLAADGTPARIAVQDRTGTPVGYVSAIGHATAREREDLSRRLPSPPRTPGGLPEVALLHTQVHSSQGAEAHHAYAPSDLSWLVRAGYDYWALGHVHIHQILSQDPPVVYAGCLQGRTHTDQGARGAALVDLSNRSAPLITFRELAPVRWETVRVGDLSEADSLDLLERRVSAAWRNAREEDPGAAGTEWMVRVVLDGPSPLWRELRAEEDRNVLAAELTAALGALDVVVHADRVHPVVPVDVHRGRVDALGACLSLLDELAAGRARLGALDAADLAGAPTDDPAAVDAYVRRLLDDVDGEVVARFLGLDGGER
ncbi:MAG: DNA repair exonuclease [Longimicrobiales bacterium]